MKYLVIATPSSIPVPPELAISLYSAAIAWADERLKNGKIECSYTYADRGGFALANANSQEELFDEMLSYPLYPFFTWEVKALVDWKHSYQSLIGLYQKMASK